MFKRTQPKTPRVRSDLIPMMKVHDVLAIPKIAALLDRIRAVCPLEGDLLIRRLIQYIEFLPDSTHRYYKERGGALEYALQRTELAMSVLNGLMLDTEQSLSDEQKCWQYAMFSASMLHGIGKIYVDYEIQCYDQQARFLATWNPLKQDLLSAAVFYECTISYEPQVDFRRRLNGILAKSIMPKAGLAWLASHPPIFEAWLALLDDDIQGAHMLGSILMYVESQIMSAFVEAWLAKLSISRPMAGRTFDAAATDPMMLAGAAFLQWLQQALASGGLSLNQPPIVLKAEGLVLNDEVFRLFVKDQPTYKNWQAVQRGFLSLNFHDNVVNTAEILFTKFGILLPAKMNFFNPHTKKLTSISAEQAHYFVSRGATLSPTDSTEQAVSLPKLDRKGEWKQETSAFLAPHLRPIAHG